MTDKEIIAVVQAHSEGKQIQFRTKVIPVWTDCIDNEPSWDFCSRDYRVKPEPKVRPYKDSDECWNDMMKHEPFGWSKAKDSGSYLCLAAISNSSNYEWLFKTYTYADGSPFGIVDE